MAEFECATGPHTFTSKASFRAHCPEHGSLAQKFTAPVPKVPTPDPTPPSPPAPVLGPAPAGVPHRTVRVKPKITKPDAPAPASSMKAITPKRKTKVTHARKPRSRVSRGTPEPATNKTPVIRQARGVRSVTGTGHPNIVKRHSTEIKDQKPKGQIRETLEHYYDRGGF